MILRIVAPLVASVGAAATLKQDLCVSPIAPSLWRTAKPFPPHRQRENVCNVPA
jgi:hypothetical protein